MAQNYGMNSITGTIFNSLNYLKEGKSVIVSVYPGARYDGVLGKNVEYSINATHFVTIVDYKEVNGHVLFYIDNPTGDANYESWFNAYNAYGEGWVSAETLYSMRHYDACAVIWK